MKTWHMVAVFALLLMLAAGQPVVAAPKTTAPPPPEPPPLEPDPLPPSVDTLPRSAPQQWLAIDDPAQGNIMQQGRRYKYSSGTGGTLEASLSDLSTVPGITAVSPLSMAPIGGPTALEFLWAAATRFVRWPSWMFANDERLAVWA